MNFRQTGAQLCRAGCAGSSRKARPCGNRTGVGGGAGRAQWLPSPTWSTRPCWQSRGRGREAHGKGPAAVQKYLCVWPAQGLAPTPPGRGADGAVPAVIPTHPPPRVSHRLRWKPGRGGVSHSRGSWPASPTPAHGGAPSKASLRRAPVPGAPSPLCPAGSVPVLGLWSINQHTHNTQHITQLQVTDNLHAWPQTRLCQTHLLQESKNTILLSSVSHTPRTPTPSAD